MQPFRPVGEPQCHLLSQLHTILHQPTCGPITVGLESLKTPTLSSKGQRLTCAKTHRSTIQRRTDGHFLKPVAHAPLQPAACSAYPSSRRSAEAKISASHE